MSSRRQSTRVAQQRNVARALDVPSRIAQERQPQSRLWARDQARDRRRRSEDMELLGGVTTIFIAAPLVRSVLTEDVRRGR